MMKIGQMVRYEGSLKPHQDSLWTIEFIYDDGRLLLVETGESIPQEQRKVLEYVRRESVTVRLAKLPTV